LTGDRGWDEAIAKIANIRGFSGQVAPYTAVVLANQDRRLRITWANARTPLLWRRQGRESE